MVRAVSVVVIMVFLLLAPCAKVFPDSGPVEVYFSPSGGVTAAIVREIGMARTEILIQAYSFTSPSIAKALIAARKRGVRIEAVWLKVSET